jgi:hypothetical protein
MAASCLVSGIVRQDRENHDKSKLLRGKVQKPGKNFIPAGIG